MWFALENKNIDRNYKQKKLYLVNFLKSDTLRGLKLQLVSNENQRKKTGKNLNLS